MARLRPPSTPKAALVALAVLVSGSPAAFAGSAPEPEGTFIREYWYEPGLEHGNPRFDGRFRVNAPEVVLDPRFMYRSEVRENGMMLIRIEEDLARVTGASLHLELWGGHPGSGEKRVTVNGRSTYVIPDVGTRDHNCTHSYPVIPLEITDLVNGYNALQFAVDQGDTFWGHFIVDNAALHIDLDPDHPDLVAMGLAHFVARITAASGPGETLRLRLEGEDPSPVARADFIARYEGYDENGSTRTRDWHYFTKDRELQAHLGSASGAPFALTWDTSMIPAQRLMAATAILRFRNHPRLRYGVPPVVDLETPERPAAAVSIHHCTDPPRPFWSRAGETRSCEIELDIPPADIERAELHVALWDGGAGNVKDYFTLNGRPIDVAGGGHHDVLYRVVPLDPTLLRRGPNTIELLSDTEHHGIEILLPGPAIVVRTGSTEGGGTP